ncbi:MAG: hypothetical protein KDB61_08890, partial [Planctomycetes bacterium]|nr:hypothetical protein [Planctomycetota bacterium]
MRLSYLPLLIAASIACHSTEPSSDPRTSTNVEPSAPETTATQVATLQNAIRVEGSLSAPTVQGDIGAQADLIKRRQEETRHLSARLVEEGEGLFDRAQMEEALASFSRALELDPSNEAARTGLRKTQAVLGDPISQVRDAFDSQVDQLMVRRAQARLQMEEYATKGDLALKEARYQDAVELYRNAANVLSIHPLIATEELDARLMEEKLNQAIRLRDENLEASAAQAQAEAAELQAQAEAQSKLQRERTLRNFYDHANEDFLANRFEEAEKWANLILAQDPDNERARHLLNMAQETRYARKDEELRDRLREEWLKTFDELNQEGVPQTDPIKFDIDRWKVASQRPNLASRDLEKAEDPDRAAVMEILRSRRFEVRFGGPDGEGTELAVVARYLRDLTGVNFYITPSVTDELDEEATTINLDLPENNVYNVLNIIAETRENLTWVVQDGIVKFVTRDQAMGGQVLVNYPVHDLITPVRDYAGPVINVAPSGGIESNEEEPDERESNVISGDQLEQLVQNSIGGDSWDNDPRNSIRVVAESGTLVVSQTPEVHMEIQALLADLREATGIMVDVQAQFVKVEDNFLED